MNARVGFHSPSLVAVLVLMSLVPLAVRAEQKAAQPAFDWSFRFASAIKADSKDMAMAQELVVLDMGLYGSFDQAVEKTGQIEGWHRGVALAELAKMATREGHLDQARVLVSKAEELRKTVSGWQSPRIAAHIGDARAMMGDREGVETAVVLLGSDDRQYLGKPAATRAAFLAARGEYQTAMEILQGLDHDSDPDVTWWRTEGYLNVAKSPKMTPEQRAAALAALRQSAMGIPGWRRAEALFNALHFCRDAGIQQGVEELGNEAEKILIQQDDQALPVKGPMLAELARLWAWNGKTEKAKSLLATAEKAIESLLVTEKPGAMADIGNAWFIAGDPQKASQFFDRAFTLAEGLGNARPRALQVVEITRAIGRAGIPLDEPTLRRLNLLLGGLKDPW